MIYPRSKMRGFFMGAPGMGVKKADEKNHRPEKDGTILTWLCNNNDGSG
jgi:hypothetical protein